MRLISSFLIAVSMAVTSVGAKAETDTITLVQQFGLTSLPLMVMQSERLVEKHVAAHGLGEVKVKYATVGGASQITDVLLSRTADIVLMGFPTLATIWAKTHDTPNEIKALSATLNMPFYLVTSDPNVHKLSDFTDKDRIAVPAVKISTMALLLQIAAAKEFGIANYAKLDPITVQMSHPSAVVAILSHRGQVNSHVATSPFYLEELKDPSVHIVMKTYDVVGGPHNNGLLSAAKRFVDANPKLCAAVLDAQTEANAFIKKQPRKAAEIYLRLANDKKDTVDEITKLITDPDIDYTNVPTKMQQFADFMFKAGLIPERPKSWKDMFFSTAYNLPGN